MSVPPKTLVACARAGRKLADPLTSNPQSPDSAIENYGLKSAVLYVSKLGCAKIIPTAERFISAMPRSSDRPQLVIYIYAAFVPHCSRDGESKFVPIESEGYAFKRAAIFVDSM
jgi:hypothetical protein